MNGFSIVIPLYNEEESLPFLAERLRSLKDQDPEINWEFVLVNDGSTDTSAEQLNALADADPAFCVIHLSRNFGQQLALTAGLDFATGDYVGIVDADLQDDPRLLLRMSKLLGPDCSLVYGQRTERHGEGWFKIYSAKLFYRLLGRITKIALPLDTGDFRVMDRKVLSAIRQMRENPRFLRGLFAWAGFRAKPFPYCRGARVAGRTSYSFRRMWKFALDAIFSFSDIPLLLASYVGFLTACIGGIGFLFLLARYSFFDGTFTLASAAFCVLFVLGGVQLLALGVAGHYIGQIYHQTKGRPLYLIHYTRNLPSIDGQHLSTR